MNALLLIALAIAAAEAPAPAPRPASIQPLAAQSLVLDVAAADGRYVAVGERGHVLVSSDAQHWDQVAVPVDAALTAVSFADAREGWAVGHDATILHTSDAGAHWQLQHYAPERESPFLDVLFLDRERGIAVGAYGLLFVTRDGGAHWTEPAAEAIRADQLHLNALAKLGDGAVLVVGESGLIGISDDAGETWRKLDSPYAGSLFGALPSGAHGALIVGLRGHAYRTDEIGAARWTAIDCGTQASLFGGAALPDGGHVVVGAGGFVARIDPDATTARVLASGAATAQSAVLALESGARLLLAGKSGVHVVETAP